jgi:hypothetical protein
MLLVILTIVFSSLAVIFAILARYNKDFVGSLAALFAGTAVLIGVHPSFTAHTNKDTLLLIVMDGLVSVAVLYLTAKLSYLEWHKL